MASRRPQMEVFTAPAGRVFATLTNDVHWAREIFEHEMSDSHIHRVAEDLDVPLPGDDEDCMEDLWAILREDAFDGGHTSQGHFFFEVTVAPHDGEARDVFVCSSLPLAHAIKDEQLAKLATEVQR